MLAKTLNKHVDREYYRNKFYSGDQNLYIYLFSLFYLYIYIYVLYVYIYVFIYLVYLFIPKHS